LPVWVIAGAVTLLAAACGGGQRDRSTVDREQRAALERGGVPAIERTDLRSPDVDARMDPVPRGTVFVCPPAEHLLVSFDPHGTVAVVGAGHALVYGTMGTRAVNRACRSLGSAHGMPVGALRERDEATMLTCALPRAVRFEVHPLRFDGRDVGSVVAVLTSDLRRILVSAVLDLAGIADLLHVDLQDGLKRRSP
jgi:hypothetical protein